jgi:hypothetical protein
MDPQNTLTLLDAAGTIVAIVLTLVIFSYLLGDNVLYRLAEHIFVGVAVGYAVVVAFHAVVVPKLLSPLIETVTTQDWGESVLLLTSLVLGLLLLTKLSRRAGIVSWLGSFSLAVLLGVGAALAIAGALMGTLWPQINTTSEVARYVARYGPALGLFSGIVVLVGVTGALLHFYFGTGGEGRLAAIRDSLVHTWGGLGHWFILIAFGAFLAATFLSRLSLLIGRIQFLVDSVRGLIGGLG